MQNQSYSITSEIFNSTLWLLERICFPNLPNANPWPEPYNEVSTPLLALPILSFIKIQERQGYGHCFFADFVLNPILELNPVGL